MMTRPHLPKRLVSVLAALFLSAAGAGAATVASSPAANAAAGCTAAYSENVWGTGFTGTFNVTNSGTTSITGWTVTLTFSAGNPTLQPGGWNGTWTQSGSSVTVTNASWNATIPANGGTADVGFNGTDTGQDPAPGAFAINGTVCSNN